MTVAEALEQRIPRVRAPKWANPDAYLRLPLFEEGHGPWAELYDVASQEVMEIRPGSQRILVIGPPDQIAAQTLVEEDGWEVYDGPRSEWEDCEHNFAKAYAES